MNHSEEELIAAIKTGGPQLNKIMSSMYKDKGFKASIIGVLLQKGASQEDAEDTFQDGVRHLIINVRKGSFRADSSLKTYLSRICINLWFTKLRRHQQLNSIKEEIPKEDIQTESPETLFFYKEKTKVLQQTLAQLGDLCKKILGLWALSYSMKEIAQKMDYKSDGMARKKKHQCFQKLMIYLKDHPELADELLNMYQSKH